MNDHQNIENMLTKAMQDYTEPVQAPPALKHRIDTKLDAKITEETMTKKWNIKKSIILFAASCFLLSVGVYAAGTVTGYVTGIKPETKYTSYDDLDKAMEKAGFNFSSVEQFSNGYNFKEMSIGETDKIDENSNRIGSFKEWCATYQKSGMNDISLYVYPTQPEENNRTPDAVTTIGDATVGYYIDHYKFVPTDYELTDEDLANDALDNYYISYGTSGPVEECDYAYVLWHVDNLTYYFHCRDTTLTKEELFQMVKEVMEQ